MSALAPMRRSSASLLQSWPAWLVLAAVATTALAVGSVHPPVAGSTARISYLESVIKCPSCADLSIAESNDPIAVALRRDVSRWVHGGESNSQIEQLVVDRFGTQALLVPPASGVDEILWIVPIVLVATGAVSLGAYLWRRRRLEAPR
jgi:cytochrome c-type biogenesis protein CcmH/NrfF